MPVKRSPSSIDASVMLPPSTRTKAHAVGNSAKAMKRSVMEDQDQLGEMQGGLLTVSSPIKMGDVSGSGFLEKCYECKKEIGEGIDVFMYSYLRAFCSVECRERQIFIDNLAEVVSKASKGDTTPSKKI